MKKIIIAILILVATSADAQRFSTLGGASSSTPPAPPVTTCGNLQFAFNSQTSNGCNLVLFNQGNFP